MTVFLNLWKVKVLQNKWDFMLLFWRTRGIVLPASRWLDFTCQNGVVGSGSPELANITQCHSLIYSDNIRRFGHTDSMATLDQKSPNVLLQSLCCRITGKSEGTLARSAPGNVRANLIQKLGSPMLFFTFMSIHILQLTKRQYLNLYRLLWNSAYNSLCKKFLIDHQLNFLNCMLWLGSVF